jgi:hypothetical protein
MSTTFGVYIKEIDDNVEIAHRRNGIAILNPLVYLLPLDTSIIPLDNTAQGINTVSDLLKEHTYYIKSH